ncbi:unnamed protein product, partial [Closterium sp. NIES-53]
MEGQGDKYATTSDIASLRTDMEQTQATLRRLEAFLTSQPGFDTAAAATTATAAPTTPAAVATPTFHGPMAPLLPNLEAARPRLPEAFDPSAKGSDVRRFVATLEIYFEAIGCSTPQHDAARIRFAASLLRGPTTGHADASWADDLATQRSSQGYTFSLGSGSVSWWSTRSPSVLGSSCEAEIYAGAMAAQELRWLTYLLADLGEPPRSPPVLYVDNKAMLALCREHRLEHRTKHIALRYFLARELQQRGQLRLAFVASEANTADIFTKALPPGDHQRFCTML